MRKAFIFSFVLIACSQVLLAKTPQQKDFYKNFQNLSNLSLASDQQSQLPPPIRQGRVKYTLSKGVFQTEGAEKWEFTWTPVCSKMASFGVHPIDGGVDSRDFESCESTMNGQKINIKFGVISWEGDSQVNPGEPLRFLTNYALSSFVAEYIEGLPSMSFPALALEKRAGGTVILSSRTEAYILCSVTKPIKPIPNPEPSPKKMSEENCQAPWKEIFKLNAEIQD